LQSWLVFTHGLPLVCGAAAVCPALIRLRLAIMLLRALSACSFMPRNPCSKACHQAHNITLPRHQCDAYRSDPVVNWPTSIDSCQIETPI